MDRERQHKQAFVEILKDPAYLWARGAGVRRRPAMQELRHSFAVKWGRKNKALQDSTFCSYLCEWFRRAQEPPSDLTIGGVSERELGAEGEKAPWRCENPACHRLNHSALSTCAFCLQKRDQTRDLHVVFILHGYGANPIDMKNVQTFISCMYPHVCCLLIHNCYSNSSQSLRFLADSVVAEILADLADLEARGHAIRHISFIAHSIGGLVFRLALNDARLQRYWDAYHLFLSLNVPHLGILFASYGTDLGTRIMNLWSKSLQLDELSLRDQRDMRQTTLYKMAQHTGGDGRGALGVGLDKFKFAYFFSSYQDTFIPFYSERAEMSHALEVSTREEATIVSEMVTAFWRELKDDRCKTVIKKFDVEYDVVAVGRADV